MVDMDKSESLRKRRKDTRPEEILDTAMGLFIKKGFAATTFDEIAQKARIAKGTLYLYFDSKEALFLAMAKKVTESQAQQLINASLDEINNSSFDEESLKKLLGLFMKKTNDTTTAALMGMVLAESHNFPEIARIWYEEVSSYALNLIAKCFLKAQERGEIKAGDPSIYALSLIGPFFLAALSRYSFGEETMPDIVKIINQHVETLLHGIKTQEIQPEIEKKKERTALIEQNF